MKSTTGQVNISVDVICPHCKEEFDLMDSDHDNELFSENTLPNPDCNKTFECSKCFNEFLLTTLYY